jgi:glutathione S-transferase
MNTTTQPVILKLSRFIKAPRERVFAAWTTPADITRWLGPGSYLVQHAKIDLRVGGTYHFTGKSEDGQPIDKSGDYRGIQPPSRLVFGWPAASCGLGGIVDTQVTVDFIEQAGGTLVNITHEGFTETAVRDRHNQGWSGSLDQLEELVG